MAILSGGIFLFQGGSAERAPIFAIVSKKNKVFIANFGCSLRTFDLLSLVRFLNVTY